MEVDHVVILVHGIRTNARWQATLQTELGKCGIRVELTNYGYFDVFSFLMPFRWLRRRAVDRVWTLVRDVRRMFPNAEISFLAHSFGTYIVAEILRREFDFEAHRIVFCGSVVAYDFPFHAVAERFTPPIINEVGSSDCWPAIAASVTVGYGSAGSFGFRAPRVRDRWHRNYKHSDFLTTQFCLRFWAPFFSDGTIVEGDAPSPPSVLGRLVTKIQPRYVCGCLLGFVLGLVISTYIVSSELEGASININGVQHEGTVEWSSFVRPPEPGVPPVLTVQGRATIPSAGVDLTFEVFPYHRNVPIVDALKRRLKCQEGVSAFCGPPWPDLDASHVVVLHQSIRSTRQVVEFPEIDLLAGDFRMPLYLSGESFMLLHSGRRVRALVLGLSGNEYDEIRNLQNLRRYPRIQMHIKFSDDTHGDIVLQKGQSGERLFRDAIEDWLQTTGDGRP